MLCVRFATISVILFSIRGGTVAEWPKLELFNTGHGVQMAGAMSYMLLANRHFEPNSILAVVKTRDQYFSRARLGVSTEDLILEKLMQSVNWSTMIKFIGVGSRPRVDFGFEKVHNYVFVYQNKMELDRALSELSKETSWNSHAKFLVYLAGYPDNFRQMCMDTVNVFWKYFVVNVAILMPEESTGIYRVVTYFPFHGRSCGRNDANYTIIGTCYKSVFDPPGINAFPPKVPDNLEQCQVKVGALNSPPFVIESAIESKAPVGPIDSGIEISIINTIAEIANFEPLTAMSYLATEQDQRQQNSSLSSTNSSNSRGLFKELDERKIDIAVGTISPSIDEHIRYDFTVQYTQDMSTWVVPSDAIIPHWMGLLLVFQPGVYVGAVGMLIFLWGASSLIVKRIAVNFSRERLHYKNSGTFLFVTVGMLFANGPHRIPTTRFLKTLLFMWTLFCFYWTSAFGATLMSVLTNTVYQGGIETEQQIVEQKLKMWMSNGTIKYMNVGSGQNDTLAICTDVEHCLGQMRWTRDSALAMSRNYFDFIKRNYTDETGRLQLKSLKSNIVTVPIEMLLSKGNPLLARINGILLNIIESGLIRYWTDHTTSRQIANDAKIDHKTEQVLTLDNLQGVFLLWSMGITMSIVVFIGELVNFYKFRKRDRVEEEDVKIYKGIHVTSLRPYQKSSI